MTHAHRLPLLALAFTAACNASPDVDDGGSTTTAESSTGDAPAASFRAVAEILGRRCSACHQDGTVAPFALTSHADVAEWAAPIAAAVTSRTMPPWGVDASGDCHQYDDARWLDDDEIDLITAWVDAGAPAGDPADDALLVAPAPDALDDTAHLVQMPEPYTPDASQPDDYRCFVLDGTLDAQAFLTAYEVRPGNREGVHHVLLYQSSSDESDVQAMDQDGADGSPGYTCFGGAGIDSYRFLAGWAPGTGVTRYPADTGIRVDAGHALVMQVHYNLAGSGAADRTAVAFELHDTVANEAEVLPLVDLELALAPGMPNVSTTTARTVEDFGQADVYGVYPHMHLLGRGLRVDIDQAGTSSCLVDVPRWDFGWQQFYFYADPIRVGDGDVTTLRCDYDTTTRDAEVLWGEGTSDEMCLAGFYFVRR